MTSRAEAWKLLDKRSLSEKRDSIIIAEERIKQQVAELLHGPIQSRLLIASFKIGQCLQMLPDDPERAASLLHQVRADLEDIRERDIRHASHLLHPSVLQVGLLPALRALARRFEGYFRTRIDYDPRFSRLDRSSGSGLTGAWRLICYRIVEECLNNAYFHAAPQNVFVTLRLTPDDRLELTVADDGLGFEPETFVPGLGFMTIFARAADASGTVRIDSKPQAGTVVTVCLPLPGAGQRKTHRL